MSKSHKKVSKLINSTRDDRVSPHSHTSQRLKSHSNACQQRLEQSFTVETFTHVLRQDTRSFQKLVSWEDDQLSIGGSVRGNHRNMPPEENGHTSHFAVTRGKKVHDNYAHYRSRTARASSFNSPSEGFLCTWSQLTVNLKEHSRKIRFGCQQRLKQHTR